MPLDLAVTEPALPDSPTTSFNDEVSRNYLTYAFSVIVSRALPGARDGFKPVHRRIMHVLALNGITTREAHRKSAKIVGDVMGQFHPHGDSSIYEAMVRMAQDWSLRVPLIDGQGNFGSIDGDSPAAMRYTEARMALATELLLANIDESTVDFGMNYDGTTPEPKVLPAGIPNLLINGAEGIAVGMVTKIPPHNPREAILAAIAVLQNPDISIEELMEIIPGPDFPTGGIVMGKAGIRAAYETGNGKFILRGVATIDAPEKRKGKNFSRAIVITELPYQVNKAQLVSKIAELAQPSGEKDHNNRLVPAKIQGIADVRDESDRDGMRVVVDLTNDADADVVLAHLYADTQLQISFSANMLAVTPAPGGHLRPETLTLKRALEIFVAHRREVIDRRSRHRLKRDRRALHHRVGFLAALDQMDLVVSTIRNSPDSATARAALRAIQFPLTGLLADVVKLDPASDRQENGDTAFLHLTEAQAIEILKLRLSSLTGLERDEIANEAGSLAASIKFFLDILNDQAKLDAVVVEELEAALATFKDPTFKRLTQIEDGEADLSSPLSLTPREPVLVTLTTDGYIKRVPTSAFRSQARGGVGKTAARPGDDQAVTLSLQCTTHAHLLVFTVKGHCYKIDVRALPASDPRGRGKAIQNFCENLQDQDISAILACEPQEPDGPDANSLIFVFSNGHVRRNDASDFATVWKSGKMAAQFDDETTRLVAVMPARASGDDLMLFTAQGKAIRFEVNEDQLRVFGSRASLGVRGIKLSEGDTVIGATIVPHGTATIEERDAWTTARNSDSEERRAEFERMPADRKAELAATERFILLVSERGLGKRTSTHEFREALRGGQGMRAADLSEKTGNLVAARPIADGEDVLISTAQGSAIRIKASDVSIRRRASAGVILVRPEAGDQVLSALRLDGQEDTPSRTPQAGASVESSVEALVEAQVAPEPGLAPEPAAAPVAIPTASAPEAVAESVQTTSEESLAAEVPGATAESHTTPEDPTPDVAQPDVITEPEAVKATKEAPAETDASKQAPPTSLFDMMAAEPTTPKRRRKS